MYSFAALAVLIACYTSMRALEVLGLRSTHPAFGRVARVLAVLVLVAAVGVLVALLIDARTLAPAVRSAREVLAPLID